MATKILTRTYSGGSEGTRLSSTVGLFITHADDFIYSLVPKKRKKSYLLTMRYGTMEWMVEQRC